MRGLREHARHGRLAPVPWNDEQKAAFLRMQFAAQHQLLSGALSARGVRRDSRGGASRPGRLYVHRGADEVRIVDIAMLPAWRNRRVGTHLIGALQAEAALARKPLRIHVERLNPALQPLRAPRLPGDRGSRRLPVPRMARDRIANRLRKRLIAREIDLRLREDHFVAHAALIRADRHDERARARPIAACSSG